MKFSLGHIVATPGALRALAENGLHPLRLIARHSSGDWGDVSAEDRLANERALVDGSRIWSVYKLSNGGKVWVITEAESVEGDSESRLSTCLLLPEEY